MSRQRVQFVLVCEDRQHEAFARFLLQEAKLVRDYHQLRIERSPLGRGAADRFVQETYVTELAAVRRTHVTTTLLVLTDGDAVGVAGRLRKLDEACERQGVERRSPGDRAAVFVPTWNIETWLAYLEGENVDERRKGYPRLERPRGCRQHVNVLVKMCRQGTLRRPAPASLQAACKEYSRRLR